MFVFRKKRFFYILFFLCLTFTSYFAHNVNNNATLNNRTYDITQVSSIPVTEKVIIVDAGHGRRRWTVQLIQMELKKLTLI